MSRRASSLALGLFLVFYTALVEGSPSVLRATLMTLAFLGGRLLWKDVHVLNTIAASAFALLLANPSSLFDIGFQLTYAATLTIILFTPPLLKRLPPLLRSPSWRAFRSPPRSGPRPSSPGASTGSPFRR
jgi:competence protein ComEC